MQFSEADYLKTLIFPVILAIPYFLVILGGIGYSLLKYKKSPKTSLLTIIALLIFGVLNIINIIQPPLNLWLISSGTTPESLTYIYGAIGAVMAVFGAIALAVLIFAVWSNREEI